jgi:hypothetical protein
MPNYAINNELGGTQQNLTSTYKTLVAATAQTTGLKRFKVYDILIGTDGTPADNAIDFDVVRQTAAGTSTPVVPQALDPADGAAVTVGSVNFTAEGTTTSSSQVLFLGINQRASYRWVCAPGSELVAPATNLAGFAMRMKSAAYTSTATCATVISE